LRIPLRPNSSGTVKSASPPAGFSNVAVHAMSSRHFSISHEPRSLSCIFTELIVPSPLISQCSTMRPPSHFRLPTFCM